MFVGSGGAVAEVVEGDADARLVLTCEHASDHLPAPWVWPAEDERLIGTHWAWDLGIAQVTRHLAAAIRAPAVLARFTRLLVDCNRPVDDPTLFRTLADGHPVLLNQDLTEAEKARRIREFHEPYHAAIDAALHRTPRAAVLSMHSFTPIYEGGPPRPMEIGVLFDTEDALAHAVHESLLRDGWHSALNEPYSGKDGLIYSARRHATRHERRALELEIRNDLASDPARHDALIRSLRHALEHAGLL